MCLGPELCDDPALRRWEISPLELAERVHGLTSLPGAYGPTFSEVAKHWDAYPPRFRGRAVHLSDIAAFMAQLLASDPFGTGDKVPYIGLGIASAEKVIAITQRQLAFIVANVLMNNSLVGGDGLSAALKKCTFPPTTTTTITTTETTTTVSTRTTNTASTASTTRTMTGTDRIGLRVEIVSASGLRRPSRVLGQPPKPFCVCEMPTPVGRAMRVRTQVKWGTLDPEWRAEGEIEEFSPGDFLVCTVYDEVPEGKPVVMGGTAISGTLVLPEGIDKELHLQATPNGVNSTLRLRLTPVRRSRSRSGSTAESLDSTLHNKQSEADRVSRRLKSTGARNTGIVYSLLSFLAVLSRELRPHGQGSVLVAAVPRAADESWRHRLKARTLRKPELCVNVSENGSSCKLYDFMAGGTYYQALTDIAGGVVGGGAELCSIANSQDESLVQFYSEVLALAFFVSPGHFVPTPATFLGVRRYLSEIEGETSAGAPYFANCGRILARDWLNQQLPRKTVDVDLKGLNFAVVASAFVAVRSSSSEARALVSGKCTERDLVNNNCDGQRRHLDRDISLWYQAFEPTMYNKAVQGALRTVVRRIGTGPWGAGLWHGDSQQYFLAVWLATSLLGPSRAGYDLDYYVYDRFCENAGNQCFLLGKAGCKECTARAGQLNPLLSRSMCGKENLWYVSQRMSGKPAKKLYHILRKASSPPGQIFDSVEW